MTDREDFEKFIDSLPSDAMGQVAWRAWQAARALEREECANVVDAEAAKWRGEQDITDFILCAAAIRARGTP